MLDKAVFDMAYTAIGFAALALVLVQYRDRGWFFSSLGQVQDLVQLLVLARHILQLGCSKLK